MRAGKTYRHTDGSWRFVVDVNPPGAPRRQVRRSGFRTKREALAAMAEVQSQAHDSGGAFVEASRQTLGSYLAEWLTASKSHYAPGAWDAARLHVERYIAPRIGGVPLRSLTTTRLKAFYAELAESGRVRGGGGLSNKTVHNVHRTLSRALNDALREHPPRIKVNPATGAHRAPSSPTQATWNVAQLRSFLEAHRDDRLHALWRLAASSGLRRGELAGLRWRDVDLETGRLAISQQRAKGGGAVAVGVTKGKRGRTVALDEATRRSLREHRVRQAEERLAVGAAWQDETGLVFTHPDGTPLHPDSITKHFKRRVRDAGLPWVKLHGLRHTHATLMLEAGVHIKVVQERLGHSSIAITGDVYSHVTPGLQDEAAERVARLMDGT